jgi:uncharacterized membrane protein YphA (DoxX/SURF4 family)
MHTPNRLHKLLTLLIATVWLANGLFCKLLNLVPRHRLIVARILGPSHATLFTRAIGISEIAMTIWILSSFKSRWCAIVQMLIVAVMNTIEFFLAPDLLLFGKGNAILALVFIAVVYCNEFVLNTPPNQSPA